MSGTMLVQQLVNGLALGCIYALIALGYTLIFGVIKVIFFAQGELSMIGAFVALGCLTVLAGHEGIPQTPFFLIPIALLASTVITGGVGLLSERIALRPIRRAHRTKQLIASLGVSIALQNIVFLKITSDSQPFPTIFPVNEIKIGSVIVTNLQVFIIVFALVLATVLDALISRSRLGLAMRATAENQNNAALAGINVGRTISMTFVIGSALAATAGLMMAMYDGVVKYDMGFLPGIKGFTAAILGGIGNVRGGIIGGIILGLVEALGAGLISSENRHLFAFVALVAILTFRPAGILGEDTRQLQLKS
jgi:branched-chain amino acid transport system permease protein